MKNRTNIVKEVKYSLHSSHLVGSQDIFCQATYITTTIALPAGNPKKRSSAEFIVHRTSTRHCKIITAKSLKINRNKHKKPTPVTIVSNNVVPLQINDVVTVSKQMRQRLSIYWYNGT